MAFTFECFSITHIGNRRKNNEDNFYIGNGALLTRDEQQSISQTTNKVVHKSLMNEGAANLIFAVSDGMGGYKDGEIASFIVADALDSFVSDQKQSLLEQSHLDQSRLKLSQLKLSQLKLSQLKPNRQKPSRKRQDKFTYIQAFQKMIEHTNNKILEYSNANNESDTMGATLSGLICFADEAVPFNIGDSSTFIYENDTLRKLTTDDNEAAIYKAAANEVTAREVVAIDAAAIDAAAIDAAAIAASVKESADLPELKKKGKLLTKYFGLPISSGVLTAAISPPIKLKLGQIYLIATDGLTDYLSIDDILKIVKANRGISAAANELVLSALGGETGGKDNITVVMIKVNKSIKIEGA